MSERNERMDRVEKTLVELANLQKETEQNLNLLITTTDKMVARNAERVVRNEERIASLEELAREVLGGLRFLGNAVGGHTSESSPPAHSAD